MKISLVPGKREPLSRQTAWGCFTANLAMPGCGSLVAGRLSGYPQLALAVIGLGITSTYGVKFIMWYFANRSSLEGDDPSASLEALWSMVRLPLIGMAIFGVGWTWALITGLRIVYLTKQSQPPKITTP